MKIIYRILLALLAVGIIGMGVSAFVKAQAAIDRSEYTIAQADEFLRWCEHHNGRR